MWTIFKVFIECVTILFLFNVLFFKPQGIRNLNSLSRDWTRISCIERWVLSKGPPGMFPISVFFTSKYSPWLWGVMHTLIHHCNMEANIVGVVLLKSTCIYYTGYCDFSVSIILYKMYSVCEKCLLLLLKNQCLGKYLW